MLVVDLMHEFELGIWKAVFKCLIGILDAAAPGGRLVTELDARLTIQLFVCMVADDVYQIQADSDIWHRHHSKIFQQCLGHEEIGRTRL